MRTRLNGAKIQELRETERGITCAELAHEVGIDKSYMSRIETGKRLGSPAVRLRIAKRLGVRVDEILHPTASATTEQAA